MKLLVLSFALILFAFPSQMHAEGRYYSQINFTLAQDSIHGELGAKEWKKFKYFEEQLYSATFATKERDLQLTAYARDSLEILQVKLMAIKVLRKKNLLHRDIVENTAYYHDVLEKLKESDIPPAEYFFLEEKMAYVDQPELHQQLQRSRWMIFGLVTLLFAISFLAIHQNRKHRGPALPALSKQETLVRNLILEGKSNKEIANELFISLSTVKSHITNIYGKLNVGNRRELLEISTGTST